MLKLEYKYQSIFSGFLESNDLVTNDNKAFQYYSNHRISSISYSELLKKIVLFNKALQEFGIKKGDRVGIVSENRLEWVISDLATNSTGIINVPTFPNFTSEQQKYIFENCNVKVIIVSNKFQLNKILSIRSELESLESIIILDDNFEEKENNIFSFAELKRSMDNKYDYKTILAEFIEESKKVELDDILTIIYTSGTTGNPKGVTLTNRNLVSNVTSILETKIINNHDEFLSFLPMCHAYERIVLYSFMITGGMITIAQSIEALSANINQVKPTIITAVPKMLETVKSKIESAINKEKDSKRDFIYRAINLSLKCLEARKVSISDKLKLKVYDKLIFSKMRQKLGGNLNYIVSGGAALQPEIHRFFHAIGLKILQGYGLTECSPVVSVNIPRNLEIGTVGPPMDNVEVKIDTKGEIFVRGDLVMKGYWNDDFATKSTIDDHGWYHTGDIGMFTAKNSLKITGRIKSIIVTSGGKNISPTPIEDLIRISDTVEHIMIIGENRDYITAIISPNYDVLKSIAIANKIQYNSIDELVKNEIILKVVKKDLDNHQSTLAKYEKVRKFILLSEPFTVETGELTPKLSLKRIVIKEKYNTEIEKMYS